MPMAVTRRSMTALMVSRTSRSTRSAQPWALILRVRYVASFPDNFPGADIGAAQVHADDRLFVHIYLRVILRKTEDNCKELSC